MPRPHLRPPNLCGRALLIPLLLSASTAAAATLSGRVVDPDERPAPRVHVIVATSLGSVADRVTDADGRFTVDGLDAGRYEIRAVHDGFQADPVSVTLANDDVRDISITLRVSAVAESIVVSAAQIDVPLSSVTDAVTVITAEDLRRLQIETVGDALRLVPGLTVVRSGGRGALTSLFPRGGASNYTLVLVDGVRVNAFGGGYDFGHLAVGDVERIEIVRGPESALFGADAVGAVVQIVTRRGGPTGGDVVVEGGSQRTARVAAAASGSRGGWSWGGAIEQTRSTGYTGTAPASGETVSNDDDHLRRASGSIEWRRADGVKALVAGSVGRDERGFPGPFGSNPIGAFTKVDRISRGVNHRREIGGRIEHKWSDRIRQRAEVGVFDLSSDFVSSFGASDSGTRRVDGRVQEDIAISTAVGLSGGVELVRERGASTFITGIANQPIPIRRTVAGTFGEFRYVAHERLFVTTGVRAEHLSRDRVEANVGAFSSRPEFPEQSITSINPKAAVSYLIHRASNGSYATRIRAGAGTGIRPPDAFEIAFTDNPNLKPERNRSVDMGIEQRLYGDRVVATATAFFNRYDDLLVTVGRALRDASRYRTDNISNARARGLELTADTRPSRALALGGTYTFVDSEILSVDGLARVAPPLGAIASGAASRQYAVGDPLTRRPRHSGAVDVSYRYGPLTVFGEVTSRGRALDVEPTFGSFGGLFFSPGYVVVNAGAGVRIGHGVELFGRVMNVGDRAYEEALGFPALRRSAIAGVRVAAGR